MADQATGSAFFDTIDERAGMVRSLIVGASAEELEWVVQNHEFAETERFTNKDDVDTGLKESPVTLQESHDIKQLHSGRDDLENAASYVHRLDEVMLALYYLLYAGAAEAARWDFPQFRVFWRDLNHVTGLDNAHAMHLSSGNWGFNVLDPFVERLRAWALDESTHLNTMLTGGMLDARTYVPRRTGAENAPRTKRAFVDSRVELDDLLRDGGIVTLVCLAAFSVDAALVQRLATREAELAAAYESATERVVAIAGPNGRDFVDCFTQLYKIRRLYDIFEYFGCYAFLRHLLLARARPIVADALPKLEADRFMRYATLYQYELAMRVLDSSPS